MPSIRQFRGRIVNVRRKAQLTANGNPQYRVEMANGALFSTKPDAQVVFEIPNTEWKGADVLLTLERNQIIRVERAV